MVRVVSSNLIVRSTSVSASLLCLLRFGLCMGGARMGSPYRRLWRALPSGRLERAPATFFCPRLKVGASIQKGLDGLCHA